MGLDIHPPPPHSANPASARTPPLATAVPSTNAQAPPYPSPVSRIGSVNNHLYSSIVPNPAVEKPEAAPSTPPPAEQDDIVLSSDDDVEAELEAMRRKMAELEEKKQRKALRKSLAGSNAPGSASPAPAASVAVPSQPEPVAQAPLPTSLPSPFVDSNPPSLRLLSPPSPPPASVVAPTATTAESLVDENPPPEEEEQAVVPVPPPVVDGPIPFGTSSQVVFSGIPEGTKELALRKFIGWALKPV